jgi:protein-tyrosine kinase
MATSNAPKQAPSAQLKALPRIGKNIARSDLEQFEESDQRIGAILVDRKSLTLDQAADIVEMQRNRHEKFGVLAVELGYCDQIAVNAALSVQSKPLPLKKEDRNQLAPHIQKILADPMLVSQFNQGMAHLELRWFTGAPERKCLSFVASRATEGCSTTVAMFAILFAQIDRRVLIIDASCDVKGQAELFGIRESSASFEQVLEDPTACLRLPQAIPSLDIRVLVSTGNLEESRQIQSKQFARLLDFASNNFDVVLVDTAPVTTRPDAFTIAMRCSGAVAVVRFQNSKSDETRELVRGLTTSGVEVVGSIGTHF